MRLALALLLLAIGMFMVRNSVVDDLYISYAYALSLLENGSLTWAGLRVEGYSNPSWVALLALSKAGGVPVTLAAKAASAGAAVGLLLDAHRRLPSGAGTALLLVLAAWPALGHWGGLGMETTLFGLLVYIGWGAVGRQDWSTAMPALLAAAATRPEGSVYVVGALVGAIGAGRCAPWRLLTPALTPALTPVMPRAPTRLIVGTLAMLALWHLGRLAYFGELLPMPMIAKAGASLDPWDGPRQAGWELLAALPVWLAALLTFRPTGPIAALAACPLLLHIAMLLVMGGDWMGHTRILMPGLLAGLAALMTAPARGAAPGPDPDPAPAPPSRRLWLLVLTLPLLLLTPSRSGGLKWLNSPTPNSAIFPILALETPLIEDLRFIVQRVANGARVETGDIGLPGLIPGVRIVDSRGLVDPVRAHRRDTAIDADYRGDDAISCVRRVAGDLDARTPAFRARLTPYTEVSTFQYAGHRVIWWCRPDAETPTPAIVRDRWLTLVDRLPELPALRWHASRWLADHDEVDAAYALYAKQPWRDPNPASALLLMAGPLPDTPEEHGFRIAPGESIRTRRLTSRLDVEIEVGGAPGVAFTLTWQDDAGVTLLSNTSVTPIRVEVTPPAADARLILRRAPDLPGAGTDRRLVWVRSVQRRAERQ